VKDLVGTGKAHIYLRGGGHNDRGHRVYSTLVPPRHTVDVVYVKCYHAAVMAVEGVLGECGVSSY
jgi:hypothetical protein